MTYLFGSTSNRSKVFLFTLFLIGLLLFLFVADARSQENEIDAHEALFLESKYPSATSCRSCHPVHYEEWSASGHAYAQLSPIAVTMQAAVTIVTNGTNGDFCIRCHTQVGINMNEPGFISNEDRHPASLEGVTCIVCHRRKNAYGKVSGRLALVEGDIFEPVYGSMGNDEMERVLQSGDFDVNTERGGEGRAIHTEAKKLSQMTTPAFCGSCHDVYHVNGFRVEETFSEYKSSPAAKKDESCQDCHMGKEPGIPSGYVQEPVAIVGGKPTAPRKRTSHMFVGPDYSIIHPGIYPHNPAAQEMATISEWLEFDYEAGWGTDDFEDNLADGYVFPNRWINVVDRYEARAIINENLKILEKTAIQRKKLLQVGYQLGDIVVEKVDRDKIEFKVEFKNGTDGHNVPTGFDAERLVFLRVTVTDKNGKVVFKSGDLDPNGDLRDLHSIYVHNGELPRDKYLFNLQSKFLVKMIRGGEREQVLPLNHSPSPLQFLRPSTRSTLLLGRPGSVRKHRRTIPPLGSKWAKYKVKHSQLIGSEGPYKANIKIIAGMVPANLIPAIQVAGFDYGMSPRDVADAVVAGHITLWERDVLLKPGRIVRDSYLTDKKVGEGQENAKPKAILTRGRKSPGDAAEENNEKISGEGNNPGEDKNRLTDEVIPLALSAFPKRPKPLLELGNAQLESGPIRQGIKVPTGAVWQPSFLAWGTYRTALQSFYNGDDHTSEWANRFDLFGNLYLTFTERIVVGFRFLDQEGRFTGYTFNMPGDSDDEGFNDEFNFKLNTLFFEGDFGELFPFLDKNDKRGFDFGLSVGRQLISFQEGMLINDNIDAIGVTKINLKPKGTANYRSTFIWGWNELNRSNLSDYDQSSSLFGWFNEIDGRKSTVAFDVIYVNAKDSIGDGIYAGLSSTQRLGNFNTAFRALGSIPLADETDHNSAGLLLLSEVSWTPHGKNNYIYVNGFWGIENFRSASRDPLAGGPLDRAGILYTSVGLGRYGAALSSRADDAFGGAIGYQMFFAGTRKQLLLELGGRYATDDGQRAFGAGTSYQAAFGRRGVIRLDAFALFDKNRELAPTTKDEFKYGGRLEVSFNL